MKRFFKLLRKYGVIKGPFAIFNWKIYHFKMKVNTRKISGIDDNVFKICGNNHFKEFYVGNIHQEATKIMAGERKILFYGQHDNNAKKDIKTRWELNRMHHLPVLAIAPSNFNTYGLISLELQESNLEKILEDTNAMEVSIAAINIITACQLMNEAKIKYNESVLQHFIKKYFCFIIKNIEKGILFSGNHYFFNLIGILWITENIEGNKQIERLKSNTYNKLEKLLKQIINKDGSLYEGSTYYHKYVLESLLYFLIFNEKSQQNSAIIEYARSIYQFCCYASFNNRLNGIGDNDSGRLFGLSKYFDYDSSDISTIQNLAKRLDFDPFNETDEKRISSINMSDKPSFGLFKLENISWRVAIRCDRSSDKFARRFIGSHFHNDQLSITASYRGKRFIVDTGVYSYVQENNIRLNNIKTTSHNTLVVDGLEQNTVHNDWKYSERRAIGKINSYDKVSFEGEHNGYKSIIHRRKIEINENLIIRDTLICEQLVNETQVKIYFHLHPDVKPLISSNEILLTIKGFVLSMRCNDKTKLSIESSRYSPEYGIKLLTKAAVITYNIKENQTAVTLITEIKQLNKT